MSFDFFYDVPTRITSNVEIDILNKDRKVEYQIQKYHRNIWQKLLALHFTTWFINVSLKDMNETKLEVAEDIGVAKRKWKLNGLSELQGVILTDTSKFKMSEKKLEFSYQGKQYLISKQTSSKQTSFYEGTDLIVVMEENSKTPPRTNYITLEKESCLPIPTILTMLHLFEIGV
ncbi:tubby C-terminal domain-like protein [Ornithinibacillus halophilus]|uniref:Tubby C-terminal domain-containing protein n=1 Tax=Ornithinibacillus halophilus TaxID=930117 RepID=A0A1M5FT03_9BACI|nr:hypothetical protein [Ornithinibacillus halophilus]SHF94539.1 hypothetical protein SAMN05216225_10108 [Ornithinibacillus halophilus]